VVARDRTHSLKNRFAILQWALEVCEEDRQSRILPAREVALRVTTRDPVSLREWISVCLVPFFSARRTEK
jgi:hypothetical protein